MASKTVKQLIMAGNREYERTGLSGIQSKQCQQANVHNTQRQKAFVLSLLP